MTYFVILFATFAVLVVAEVAWLACMWRRPRRARVQVDELEAAWALTADEPVWP